MLGDVGSFFFDLTGDNDGFRVAVAAAEWAGTQTVWPDLGRDLDEGVAAVVLGSEWNANQSAQLDHCRALAETRQSWPASDYVFAFRGDGFGAGSRRLRVGLHSAFRGDERRAAMS